MVNNPKAKHKTCPHSPRESKGTLGGDAGPVLRKESRFKARGAQDRLVAGDVEGDSKEMDIHLLGPPGCASPSVPACAPIRAYSDSNAEKWRPKGANRQE